jgi:ketosteroid isomerase-like protein
MAVKGWPWNMTALMYWTDHLTTPEGERVYENRGAFYIKLRWGKVVAQDDFLDTQKVAKLDDWLAAHASKVGQ